MIEICFHIIWFVGGFRFFLHCDPLVLKWLKSCCVALLILHHNCIDWLGRVSDPDSSNIYHQLTIDPNSNSSRFLITFIKLVLHHQNLNSLPPRPIKLKDGVNFQNMLPTSSNSSSLLFPGAFIQRIKGPNFSFQRVYSEFDKFTTRRSFCSQTNVITASQPSQGAWTNRITLFIFRWDFEDIHPRHISILADYHIPKASFTNGSCVLKFKIEHKFFFFFQRT